MDFTIIGLLGPAGSGKDLVADWLAKRGFVKVAFSDPMKRFSQKAFSLSYEQLWGPSQERNKQFPIDTAWWFNAMGNLQGAAKEIVQDVLQEGDKAVGYLKLLDWFTWLRKTYPTSISAREILQTVGTEWGRTVDPLIWCRYAHQVSEVLSHGRQLYSQEGGLGSAVVGAVAGKVYQGVVIPDHRFVNEVEETKKHGYVIRLRRLAREPKVIGIENHPSEVEQAGIPDSAFNLVLEFPEGIEKVHAMLEEAMKEQSWTRLAHSS
jgi:hypothetical protein